MIIIADVTITNDGATILKELEVERPAAKVMSSGTCKAKRWEAELPA